ncbi:MAG: rod shape-determining protein MreD [Rikenellaceae bacterium]
MYRIIEYTLLFIIVSLLQFFVFSNLSLGVYVNPMLYLGFIILLPIELSAFWTLMLSLVMGFSMDYMLMGFGLNTIACLFTGFIRPFVLRLIIARDETLESGIPTTRKLGRDKFLKYSSIIITLHCLIFFSLEAPNFTYFHFTLLRILTNSLLSILLIYFTQYLFTNKR